MFRYPGVDGGFSRWSFWSDCSVTCGEGFQTRTRTCTNPPPQGKGKDCDDDLVEERPCNEGDCPDEGEFYSSYLAVEPSDSDG